MIVITFILEASLYCAHTVIFVTLFILSLTFGSLALSSIYILFIDIKAVEISAGLAYFCCISAFDKCMWVEQTPQELWKKFV